MGLLQLELIEPNLEPSTWRDFLDTHGEGVHHIAFHVGDVSQTLEFLQSREIQLLQKGDFKGDSYLYVTNFSPLWILKSLACLT